MRKVLLLAVLSLAAGRLAHAQGRPGDWPSYGGNAQRTGWEKSDSRITPENVKDFRLVIKKKLENRQAGPHALTPPVVIGMLISYRGFKELAFVAGSSGTLWSLDADLERMFWEKPLPGGSDKGACAGMAPAMPALVPPRAFGGQRPRPVTPPVPGAGQGSQGPKPALGNGFGAPLSVFALAGDGKLHRINSATGDDQIPPQDFLPANAKAGALTISNGVIYTTTHSNCGGVPNGVWATDLISAEPTVANFPLAGVTLPRLGGFAMGSDGTVYVQTGPASGGAQSSANTLFALSPNDLKKKGSFTVPAAPASKKSDPNLNLTTPVVFTYKGKDLVVAAAPDGGLNLLDAAEVSGDGAKALLYKTPPLTTAGHGVWGGLSSWEDEAGTRWVLAPVWGPIAEGINVPGKNGDAPNGSLVSFKLADANGKLSLTPVWVSHDMDSPEPPVITSGHVFTLAAGKFNKDERPKGSSHATFYALDANTGQEVFSSKNEVTAPGSLTGLTIANARVYFTTVDNTLYAYGIYLER